MYEGSDYEWEVTPAVECCPKCESENFFEDKSGNCVCRDCWNKDKKENFVKRTLSGLAFVADPWKIEY